MELVTEALYLLWQWTAQAGFYGCFLQECLFLYVPDSACRLQFHKPSSFFPCSCAVFQDFLQLCLMHGSCTAVQLIVLALQIAVFTSIFHSKFSFSGNFLLSFWVTEGGFLLECCESAWGFSGSGVDLLPLLGSGGCFKSFKKIIESSCDYTAVKLSEQCCGLLFQA